MRTGVEQATGVELAAIELPAAVAPLIPIPPVPGQVAEAPLPPSTALPLLLNLELFMERATVD